MISKKEAHYTPNGSMAQHCSICLHFAPPQACRVVTGEIVSAGWCMHFRKKPEKKRKK